MNTILLKDAASTTNIVIESKHIVELMFNDFVMYFFPPMSACIFF